MVTYTISSCYGNVAINIITIVIVAMKTHILLLKVTVAMLTYVV